jgi:hypothetical protein
MTLPQAAYRTSLSLIVLSTLIASLVSLAHAQHSVELNWQDPNNPPNTVDYKVWRKELGGEWAFIGTTHYPTLSFDDTTVVSGKTYKYDVRGRWLKACTTDCVSAFSNKVTVTIPNP